MSLSPINDALLSEMRTLRRTIHTNPELGYEEFLTTDAIAAALDHDGITVRRRSGTGLVAEIGSGDRLVAFRSDIDALPIHEPADLPFASQTPGIMHACGHDAHAAIGVGIARHLAQHPLPGRIRFIFQPAEEQFPGGATHLVNEGVIDDVESIVAFHIDPSLDAGKVGIKSGPVTSSSDRFEISLVGPGGHTARPHETVDIINLAGAMVTQLPSRLYQTVDARIPVVLVFGQIHGGSADNVIPTEVTMSGTCRVLDQATWSDMPGTVERLMHEIAATMGATAKLTYTPGIAPVVNDPTVAAIAADAIRSTMGPDAIADTYASMGAEDFSCFLQHIPGALLRLGAWDGTTPKTPLHSARFTLDESSLAIGIEAGSATLLALFES